MNIVKSYPPNIDKIKAVLTPHEGYCYTYGDTIYSPDNDNIHFSVVSHEEIHSLQQGNDPEAWWDKYLADKEFRFAEELVAYRVQYQFAQKFVKDKNKLDKYLRSIAKDLSSSSYGNLITQSDAMIVIKNLV